MQLRQARMDFDQRLVPWTFACFAVIWFFVFISYGAFNWGDWSTIFQPNPLNSRTPAQFLRFKVNFAEYLYWSDTRVSIPFKTRFIPGHFYSIESSLRTKIAFLTNQSTIISASSLPFSAIFCQLAVQCGVVVYGAINEPARPAKVTTHIERGSLKANYFCQKD